MFPVGDTTTLDNLLDEDALAVGFAFSKNTSDTFVVMKYE